METFFIRHTAVMGIDSATRHMLWDSHRIAIQFNDISSLRPEDYDRAGQHAMRTLLRLAQEGGYVERYKKYSESLRLLIRASSSVKHES